MTAEMSGTAKRLHLDLPWGRVAIALRPDLAPRHVARVTELIAGSYYDGLPFHRVIDGFMAQTGCPNGDGTGGTGVHLSAEFSDAPHVRGTVSMARRGHPDSADSQFFIVLNPAPWLDGQYTVWGEVVEGMEHMDCIKRGDDADNGTVENPDRIMRLRLADETSAAT